MVRYTRSTAWVEFLEARQLLARVAVIGDFTSGSGLNDVARMIKGWNPAAIATVGDNYYDNDPSIDATVGQSFHDYVSPYTGAYGAGSPTGNRFWPTLGNHDYDRGLSKYTNYFTLPNNERYYVAPPVGDIQFFVVDSNSQEPDGTSSTSKQAMWLKNALATSTATWKLVLFHHPAYSSGQQSDALNMRWPFQQWGATAVISGHDHQYERLLENKFPFFVNGLGGAEIMPIAAVEPGSVVRYNGDFGAMQINSTDTTLNFKFFSRDGVVRDDYTITKSTPAPTTNLIPAGATWRYLDTGSNAAAAWRAPGFDDSAWKSGAAQLGYGDGDEATVVSYGPSASNKYVTTYFRTKFTVADPSQIATLAGSILRDDGAVVYVNGTEVNRTNMPAGTVGYNTLASSAVEDNVYYGFDVPTSLLVAGDNVIAVEVHQASTDSSDISFDLTLDATLKSGGTTPTVTPAAPTALTATAGGTSSVALAWTDNASDETGFSIERSADGGATFTPVASVAANVTQYTDTGLSASTAYAYRVRALNAAGASAYSNAASATTAAAPVVSTLPTPWANADIGSVVNAGSAAYANGTFTVKGGGGDVWGNTDAFGFVYQPVVGDATIVARVVSMGNTHGWAKAGVMIRESLDAGARNVAVHVTPSNGTVMTYRSATNGTSNGDFSSGSPAIWLKLVRTGNTLTGYRSSTGTTWTLIGTETVPMAPTVYVGLCVAAKNTATLNTATFSNVTITATTTAGQTTTTAAALKKSSAASPQSLWVELGLA